MLKLIYTFFLGLLIAIFVGVGISTFFPAPEYPKSEISNKELREETPSAEIEALRIEQNEQQEAYDKELAAHNRIAALIVLGFTILLLVVSLTFATKLDVISDGLLLGGVFLLAYSIGLSLEGDAMFRFVMVSAGLVIALILGYLKFLKPLEK